MQMKLLSNSILGLFNISLVLRYKIEKFVLERHICSMDEIWKKIVGFLIWDAWSRVEARLWEITLLFRGCLSGPWVR